MKSRIASMAGPLLAFVLFSASASMIYHEVRDMAWDDFRAGVAGVPPVYLVLAAVLVALNYALLMTYDLLGLRYLGRSLPLGHIGIVSFLGFSLGNNLGTLLAATPVRFRFYRRWGLRPAEVIALVGFLGLTFWSGATLLGGTVLLAVPLELPGRAGVGVETRTLGGALLAIWLTYAALCTWLRRPLPFGPLRLPPPDAGMMLLQSSVAALDLTVSATALYLVLPVELPIPFAQVLAVYVLGMAAGLLTQVPGQWGVLDLVVLTLLKQAGSSGAVLGSVLLFRLLYYIAPLCLGAALLVAWEVRSRRPSKAQRPGG